MKKTTAPASTTEKMNEVPIVKKNDNDGKKIEKDEDVSDDSAWESDKKNMKAN